MCSGCGINLWPESSPVRYVDMQHQLVAGPGPGPDVDVVVSIRAAVKAACTNIEKKGRRGSVCSYANDVPTSKQWPIALKPGTVLRRSQSSHSQGNKASCRPADLMLGLAWLDLAGWLAWVKTHVGGNCLTNAGNVTHTQLHRQPRQPALAAMHPTRYVYAMYARVLTTVCNWVNCTLAATDWLMPTHTLSLSLYLSLCVCAF